MFIKAYPFVNVQEEIRDMIMKPESNVRDEGKDLQNVSAHKC